MFRGRPVDRRVSFFYNRDDGSPEGINPFMMYQGLIIRDAESGTHHHAITRNFEILTEFLPYLAGFRPVAGMQSWRHRDMRPFLWHNYHAPEKGMFVVKPKYTAVIDLTEYASFGDYVASTRSIRQRELKKARAIRIKNSADVQALVTLHDLTYGRQGKDVADPLDFRRAVVTDALEKGYGALWEANTEAGERVSMIFTLADEQSAYYLFGANHPDYRSTGGSTKLMFACIEQAMEQGLAAFDFCGVNSPNRGDYKISFNAQLKEYCTFRLDG